MRAHKELVLTTLLVFLAGLFALPAKAFATLPPPPGVRPINPGPNGYFYYVLNPGQSASGKIYILNQSQEGQTYEIYPTNATTSPVTGVAYGQEHPYPIGVASWISINPTEVTLLPNKGAYVSFTVTVPKNLSPGDYVGSVASQALNSSYTTTTQSGKNQIQLVVSSRVVIAVVIHIPGIQIHKIFLGKPYVYVQNGNRQVLVLPMDDTGNVLMKPYLSAEVIPKGSSKASLFISRQLDTFVPRTSIDYPWYINPPQYLPNGCYVVKEAIYFNSILLDKRTTGLCLGAKQTSLRSLNKPESGLSLGVKLLIGALSGLILILLALLILLLIFIKRRDKEDKEIKEIEQSEVNIEDLDL